MSNAFRTLDHADVKGKRVLMRVDLNVPFENGVVSDATRIERAAPSITELADKGAKVILLSHFGRPKGRDAANSLKPVAAEVAHTIKRPIKFVDDCVGEKAERAVAAMRNGDILCLENTRFYPGEEKNDPAFVAQLAKLGDLLRQRRLLGLASRPCFDRRPEPRAARFRRPHVAGRTRSLREGARQAGPPARRDRRRRQDFHQARSLEQSAGQGRRADHRRRHGQHLS